jgi:hypothetical protein
MPKPIAYDAKIPNGKIKGTFLFQFSTHEQ